MAEPRFADDDDLPRTLRRERDARERELREREAAPGAYDEVYGSAVPPAYNLPYGGYEQGADGSVTVTRLAIPFLHLVLFFLKAVLAAIPALLLLTVLLWAGGQGLKAFYPDLRHFEIVIKPAS
jgi:hypothetical protein